MWFLTTAYKVLRRDSHSLGAGTGQVLYYLCPDHTAILFMALKTRRCCWPSGVPQEPRAAGMDGCVPVVASSTLGCLCWEGPKWTLPCEIRENESTDCRGKTRSLALLVREGQPLPQGSAEKSHLSD